jgi:hypothetical protein
MDHDILGQIRDARIPREAGGIRDPTVDQQFPVLKRVASREQSDKRRFSRTG